MPELKPSRREGEEGVFRAILDKPEITVTANAVTFYAGLQPEAALSEKIRDLTLGLGRASMSEKDQTVVIFEPGKPWEQQSFLQEALKVYGEQLESLALDCVMDDNPDMIQRRDDVLSNAFMVSALYKMFTTAPCQKQVL